MAEAWSAVPEWIRKAEADWFGEDGRMRAALFPLQTQAFCGGSTGSWSSEPPALWCLRLRSTALALCGSDHGTNCR